ncbi:type II secretion system protein N [Legionella jamestowniensis]|uniref:General secretion pathway protein C n=1 Tax=Legionella jamestowniensis TaxID=455 RepID=A0A0W0UTP2_9GAMM|nr:type II secretion system protein N [Legionella jamestowniensis]KTD11259.1 general secretion pathway protein C [Legionella jamestowniensis]OCH98114.1 hypothetical protein A8135_13220 [Legionella jamestowniensis]SFL69843.1 general secretion pathway protein C [Legionella jamestowniensis DSM 19215]
MKNTKFSLAYIDHKLLMAVFLFFLTFFLFLWEIINFFQSTKQVTVTTIYRKQPVQETLHSRSPIFTTPLFGDYLPANLAEADIKQSMLDAEIVGIMFDDNEEYSQVIIKVGGGPEKVYSIGDSLPGGAIIKRISPDAIVVLHNGALESLSLPKNELIFEAPAKPLIEE